MQIDISHTSELLSNRLGLLQLQAFIEHYHLEDLVNQHLPQSKSNHSYKASAFVTTLLHMILDGATALDDVRLFQNDEAYQLASGMGQIPSADAIGDWLRRIGGQHGEEKLLLVNRELLAGIPEGKYTLDIDATIIASEKGDAQKSYKGIIGYHPLIGMLAENGMAVRTEFRKGNHSPQEGLAKFIRHCIEDTGNRITCVRSDSAGYQKGVVKSILATGKYYSITAKHTENVMAAIEAIPPIEWRRGLDADAFQAPYEVAETTLKFAGGKHISRLLVKRTKREGQIDMFDQQLYTYWAVITNLPHEAFPLHKALHFHQNRGIMEKNIGELKEHFNLGHLPCGQFAANAAFFTIGILAYNIVQMMKMSGPWKSFSKASVKTLRHKLFHVAGKLVRHANVLHLRLATLKDYVEIIRDTFLQYRLSPG